MKTVITRRTRLLGGAALGAVAVMTFAGSASAQVGPQPQPQATEVDEVIVTGIRASIENSIATKRSSSSIVEVVTAEDIGKLPDVSIAESLARLPGLTAQRLDGRGQVISIRGLAPDFTTALLNGREQVSAGDNRGVEFDQYPSELLGSVLVYKTPDAALIGQGLAGTADLRTIRPLEHGRRTIALNARYEWNEYGALNSGTEDTGQRFSVSYIDQFMDGTLGVVLGYAHMSTPYQAERFAAWGYPNSGSNLLIGGAKPYVQSSELVRDGYIATIEYRPNENWHSTFDAFYSEFDNTQILRGIEFPLAWGGSSGACPGPAATCRPGPALRPGFTVEDGMIVAGTFDNVKGVVRNDGNRRTAELTSLGWNNVFRLGGGWEGSLDLSYSKADRTDVVLETYSGTGRNVTGALDSLSFRTTPEGTTFSSILNYADPTLIRLTSPQGWGGGTYPQGVEGGQDGFINSPSIVDELSSIRGEMGRDYDDGGPFTRFAFGFNLTSRDKELNLERYYLSLVANRADPLHNTSVPVPSQFLMAPTQLTYLGLGPMISYDPFALVASGIYDLLAPQDDNLLAFGWSVSEEVMTSYWKADLDSVFMGAPVTGNLGFQVVHTEQSSDGIAASGNPATPVAVSGGDSYTQFLPSMNLSFEVANNLYVRVGAAREMARPRMDQMRASINIDYNDSRATSTDVNNGPWGGSGGNPNLRPWIANALDISIEKYFGRAGYVSLAGFYKDLDSYIYDQQQLTDFTGYPITGPQPTLRQGYISTPQNGEGGEIQGVEFAMSVPFDMIWAPLEGFGATFSASYTDSNIIPNPGSPSTPLPGLSEKVGNLTVYYERDGLQARISNRYRSEFIGELSGIGTDRIQRMVDAESVVDAQIGYEFQSGPLEGLSALFQVNNLTDEQFKTFENNDRRRVLDYQQYGRTFLVGVNYRY